MAPKWLKKNALKNRDDQRTNAAELTLRQSIFPIVLVTILFFLWVSGIPFYSSAVLSGDFGLEIKQMTIGEHTTHPPTQLVRDKQDAFTTKTMLTPLPSPGLLLRPPRHPKQTLPKHPQHHARPLLGPASRLLWCLPARFSRSRQLDPAPLWLQSDFHLGPMPIWRRISCGLALHFEQVFWRVLCGDFHYWEWAGEFGDRREPVYYGLWAAEVFGDSDQFFAGF
jgi:hypothetical protein